MAMEFKRRKVRGLSSRTHREWLSACGNYRIAWSCEMFGVRVPPRFYACVQTTRFDGSSWWNFVGRRGPYKTFRKAVEECQRNQSHWNEFLQLCQAPGRRRERLKELQARAGNVMRTVPVWVQQQADPTLLRMLFPRPKAAAEEVEPSDITPIRPDLTATSPTASKPNSPSTKRSSRRGTAA